MSSSGNPFDLPNNASGVLFEDFENERNKHLYLNLVVKRLKQLNEVMDSAEYKACPAVYRPSTPPLNLIAAKWSASFFFWRAHIKSWKVADADSQVNLDNQGQNQQHDEGNANEDNMTNEHRLSQRQKQIMLGKGTEEYKTYKALVPLETRRYHRRHIDQPNTPDITRPTSKRGFDGLMRQWRKLLHTAAEVATHEAKQQKSEDSALQNELPKNRK